MENTLYKVFEYKSFIRVCCYSLILKMESIKSKYPGGIRAFVERHAPQCTPELVALCSMGEEDLEEPTEELLDLGFEWDEDMAGFDAMLSVMYFSIGAAHRDLTNAPMDAQIPYEWLQGTVVDDCVHVRFRPDGSNETKAPDDTTDPDPSVDPGTQE